MNSKIEKTAMASHKVWHKFSNYLIKSFGKDLHGKWQTLKIKNAKTGKPKSVRFRSFNDLELSRRLTGYNAMQRIEKFIAANCPEIKVIHCDDSVYASSIILLVPHPGHGITVMFIPQCTTVQNHFFLYESHFNNLISHLLKMKSVYTKSQYQHKIKLSDIQKKIITGMQKGARIYKEDAYVYMLGGEKYKISTLNVLLDKGLVKYSGIYRPNRGIKIVLTELGKKIKL